MQTQQEIIDACAAFEQSKPTNLAESKYNADALFAWIQRNNKAITEETLHEAVQACRDQVQWLQVESKPKGTFADRLAAIGEQAQTGRRNWAHREETKPNPTLNDAVKKMQETERLRVFHNKLAEIGSLCEIVNGRINHSGTQQMRETARVKLRAEYPEFASLV